MAVVDICQNSQAGDVQGFLLEVLMDSPLVYDHPILLEALLARRMVDLGDNFDMGRIPLARLSERVWCASQSFLVAPVRRVRASFIRAIKPGTHLERPHLGTRPIVRPVDPTRRATRNAMDVREAAVCRSLIWWGRGNAGEIERLTSGLREIGAKRAQGYGVIASVQVTTLDGVGECFGACRQDGSPTRPLPRAWWEARGGTGKGVDTIQAIGLPRWSAEPEEVVAPEEDSLWPQDLAELIEEARQ